jgi:hypothetical protein
MTTPTEPLPLLLASAWTLLPSLANCREACGCSKAAGLTTSLDGPEKHALLGAYVVILGTLD